MCLDATEEHRTQLGPVVQLLLHCGDHAEASFGHWPQASSPQLRHRGAQACWILLCQYSRHLQEPGHLCQKKGQRPEPEGGVCGVRLWGLREEGIGGLDSWV